MRYRLFGFLNILHTDLGRGFKALKQATKVLFQILHRPEEALQTYIQLLTYTKSAVTRNYSEKSINKILDYVGGGKGGPLDVNILERFYQVTKEALEEAKNDVSQWSESYSNLEIQHAAASFCENELETS